MHTNLDHTLDHRYAHTGILLKNCVAINKGAVTKTYFYTGKPCSQHTATAAVRKKHLWPITQMLEPRVSLSPPLQPAVLKLSNKECQQKADSSDCYEGMSRWWMGLK